MKFGPLCTKFIMTALRLGKIFNLSQNYTTTHKALATVTAAIHQNINFKDTAVLWCMLFIRQKTYSCAKMFVYSSTAPSFMPNLTLTPN